MLFFIKYRLIFLQLMLFPAFALFSGKALAARIILDPGHSPNKPGAVSCIGEKEYKYNDQLAEHIKRALGGNKINAALTRLPNQNMSLMARTKNTKGADLFLSVHHDSAQPQFIKYTDGNPTSNKAEGYSLFVSRKNKYFDQSVESARKIAQNLYDQGLRPSHHHGEKIPGENREALDEKLGIYVFDDLIVLKNSQCPAILLEAGVIINPKDEERVKTEEFKAKVSKAVLSAVNKAAK